MNPLRRNLATLCGAVVVYYAIPTGELPSNWSAALSIVGLVAGGAVLALLILAQVRRQLQAGEDNALRMESLLALVYLSVLVFAFGYYLPARSTDDQFQGLETKTDALYFTVSTAATVGFGDIHPVGQAARAIVTGQVVFNLVFLGVLVSLMTNTIKQRAAAARESGAVTPLPPRRRR